MTEENRVMKKPVDVVAAVLFGLGLALGFLPIGLASLIVKRNLFFECIDRMGVVWRSRGWQ